MGRPAAPARQPRPLCLTPRNIAFNPFALPLHRQRPHLRCGVEGIADADLLKGMRKGIDEIVMPLFVHDNARERRTDLAGNPWRKGGNGGGCLAQIVIVEDDAWRLSAQFQRATGNAFTANRSDLPPRQCRSSKADFVHARIADEQLRYLAVGGKDIDDACGQADFIAHFGEEIRGGRCFR